MKRLLAFILAFTMLSGTLAFAESEEPKYTRYKNKKDEAWLWNELSQHSPSDYVTAAVLSYFWRESQYRSDSLSGWATMKAQANMDICSWILKKTDKKLKSGKSKKFFMETVRQCGGYGLGQWYSYHYISDLYDFASEYGTSIGDARMQCEFIFYSIKKNHELWHKLKKCKDADKAGRLMSIYYDGSQDAAPYMGYKAQKLYEKYHEEEKAA